MEIDDTLFVDMDARNITCPTARDRHGAVRLAGFFKASRILLSQMKW